MAEQRKKNSGDPRAKAVGNVWGSALAMLALCIPLCAFVRSAMIPVAVIVGAAVVTFYVWNSRDEDSGPEQLENEALKAKIKELEERLANVEVINRFEDRLAEKRLQQAEETRETSGETAPSRTQEKG